MKFPWHSQFILEHISSSNSLFVLPVIFALRSHANKGVYSEHSPCVQVHDDIKPIERRLTRNTEQRTHRRKIPPIQTFLASPFCSAAASYDMSTNMWTVQPCKPSRYANAARQHEVMNVYTAGKVNHVLPLWVVIMGKKWFKNPFQLRWTRAFMLLKKKKAILLV